MTDMMSKLRAPFPPERISWRVGSTNKDKTRGMALAYIDARDVQDRLDDACGPENWQCRYPHANGKTVCEIGIKFDGEWIWKANGAGDTDFEAEKGALSDAFKRAAVLWGIGRYLYDVAAPWVEIEAAGKSYKIKGGEEKKLDAILRGNAPKPLKQEPEESGAHGDDTDRKKKAADWCYAAKAQVEAMKSDADLSKWHKANASTIAKAKELAPNAHAILVKTIADKSAQLSPIAA